MNPPQNYHFHYPNNFPDFTPDIPQLSNDEKQRNVWNWLEEHEDHTSQPQMVPSEHVQYEHTMNNQTPVMAPPNHEMHQMAEQPRQKVMIPRYTYHNYVHQPLPLPPLRPVRPVRPSSPYPQHLPYPSSSRTAPTSSQPLPYSPKALNTCQICGFKPSGSYHGIFACDPCRHFFRRCCRKDLFHSLQCSNGTGQCVINVAGRHRCASCRLQKCLAVGMCQDMMEKKKGIRRKLPFLQNVLSVENAELMKQMAAEIVKAHMESSTHTELKISSMRKVPNFEFEEVYGSEATPLKTRLLFWQQYSALLKSELDKTCVFLKALPYFHKLPTNDQIFLLSNHSFSIFLLRMARGFSPKGLILANGQLIEHSDLQILYGEALTARIYSFKKIFSQLSLTDGDIAVFISVVITKRPQNDMMGNRVEDEYFLADLHNFYRKVLEEKLRKDRRNGSELFLQLSELMEQLVNIEEIHFKSLNFLRQMADAVDLPEVFRELYNCKVQAPDPAQAAMENDYQYMYYPAEAQ